MAFSPKDIKRAQRIAAQIAKEKEAKQAKESKHDKVISDNLSAKEQVTSNFLLQSTVQTLADAGDEGAKELMHVTKMLADDMLDNLQRSLGKDVPKRKRSADDEYKILFYKIRMPQNRAFLMEAMLKGDKRVIRFMTQMRVGRLPSDDTISYVQGVIRKLAKEKEKEEK